MEVKSTRWHLECRMDSLAVIVANLGVNGFRELAQGLKSLGITQLELELAVEGFLVAVFLW